MFNRQLEFVVVTITNNYILSTTAIGTMFVLRCIFSTSSLFGRSRASSFYLFLNVIVQFLGFSFPSSFFSLFFLLDISLLLFFALFLCSVRLKTFGVGETRSTDVLTVV